MAKASARRASDDKLERLQAFVDAIAAEATERPIAGLSEEWVRKALARIVAASQALASERPEWTSFADVMAQAGLSPIQQAREAADLAADVEKLAGTAPGLAVLDDYDALIGRAAVASGFAAPPIGRVYMRGQGDQLIDVTTMDPEINRTLVDHQDDDGFVFIAKEQITPCKPCSGTGEIIEYPPDDDERMVACPACGGTGEAITL